ncbi:MAG: DUF3467 domain-containing protein [Prevotella sp.]|nr:DUF3467 domain-containing protein [Prevotella sp.]
MENNNNKGQMQIELPHDVAKGEYSNLAIIAHSSSDFILDFATLMPGIPKATVRSRVIMAPEHAKRLLMALQENIVKYEKEFGTIQMRQSQKGIIAPFQINKNEA